MKKRYELTDEHRTMLPGWRDKWISNAMSTEAMTDDDRRVCIEAVHGLYAAAKLPPPKHIVFVPSPFVLSFAGGFAAAIWHRRRRDATYEATRDATLVATLDATLDATSDATRVATSEATYVATREATYVATYGATREATRVATSEATYEATKWYKCQVNEIVEWVSKTAGEDATYWLNCARSTHRMWQGGNQWSAWDSYLSFFRHVAKLDLPQYKAYRHWETLALHSGPRIVHPDFCMISDRPSKIEVDNQNRPHCSTGPFCEWRDGSALYSLNGVRVPAWLVETPAEKVDPAAFAGEKNVEVRREIVRKVGIERLLSKLDCNSLDKQGDMYELLAVNLGDDVGVHPYLKMRNPSIGVWHMEAVPQEIKTVEAALNWRNGGAFKHIQPVT